MKRQRDLYSGAYRIHRAIQAREDDALKLFKTGREQLRNEVAASVTCNIRIYMTASGVTGADEAEFVAMMRNLGGFTRMVEVAIGQEPDAKRNEIGMPTAADHWIWTIKTEMINDIINVVKDKLNGPADGPDAAAGHTNCEYDYVNQAWVKDGRYERCGHQGDTCGCFGRLHAGEPKVS